MRIFKGDSYHDYVQAQVKANERKLNNSWVQKEDIVKISKFSSNPKNILCHGTRKGLEQLYFLELYPTANVVGTEISPTATQFKYTVQHDFHDVNNDWINCFDILYSNSFDHTYDPEKCLSVWAQQLQINKIIAIDVSQRENVNMCDRLYIEKDEMTALCKSVGIDKLEIYDTKQKSFMFIGRKTQ
jgi:hypothetical protein